MLNVDKLYSGYDKNNILQDISFEVLKGQIVCIIGPNGCGKSTLLKSISNVIDYDGSIRIENKEVKSLNRKELAKKIGLMSQITQIYFPYTVYETVSLGRYAHSEGILSNLSSKDKDIIIESIKMVNLDEYKDKMINELSGGQLQRVFLARIFAQNPDLILLDEPTNHLDLKHQIDLLNNLTKWARENNKTIIAVLHDLNLVQSFADKVLVLNDGNLIKYSKVDSVLKDNKINEVYEMNIRKFMIDALKKWE